MFSARLLMPRDVLKRALPEPGWQGWRAVYGMAERFVVSPTAMIIRLEELGWGIEMSRATRDREPRPRLANPALFAVNVGINGTLGSIFRS